jgi:putative membrane protein
MDMSFLIKVLVNGVALWIASVLLEGIEFGSEGDTTTQVVTIGAVALIFGILNAVMLWLTSWLSDSFGLDFTVESFFWDAVLGALVITLVSLILNAVLPDGK